MSVPIYPIGDHCVWEVLDLCAKFKSISALQPAIQTEERTSLNRL